MAEFVKRKDAIDAEMRALEAKKAALERERQELGTKVWVVVLTIKNWHGSYCRVRGTFTSQKKAEDALAAIPRCSDSKYSYLILESKLDPDGYIGYVSD